MAQAYATAAPERMVWGSDWPHRGEKQMPDDAVLFDLLATWAPDEATRRTNSRRQSGDSLRFLQVDLPLGESSKRPGVEC